MTRSKKLAVAAIELLRIAVAPDTSNRTADKVTEAAVLLLEEIE